MREREIICEVTKLTSVICSNHFLIYFLICFLFSFLLVAKDSSDPSILKRVLSSLCKEWQPDMSALTEIKADSTECATGTLSEAPCITQFVGRKQVKGMSRSVLKRNV